MPTCPAEICVLSFLPQHVSTAQYLHVGPATSVLTCLGPGHCHTAMAARAVWKLFGFKQKEEEVAEKESTPVETVVVENDGAIKVFREKKETLKFSAKL